MHRYLLTAAACLGFIAIAAGGITAGAQVDAAELDSRLAGYPELTIRLTADGLEAPATAAAGRTLLIEENVTEAPGHAFLFRVPDDVSDDELAAVLAVEASAAEVTPEWFWRADFAGIGDRAALEQPARALVDLLPGRYVAGDPYRPPTEYAQFVVTGETGETGATAPAAGPAADVVAELFEMGFTLPAEIASGRQVWEVRNTGAMLHELMPCASCVFAGRRRVKTLHKPWARH